MDRARAPAASRTRRLRATTWPRRGGTATRDTSARHGSSPTWRPAPSRLKAGSERRRQRRPRARTGGHTTPTDAATNTTSAAQIRAPRDRERLPAGKTCRRGWNTGTRSRARRAVPSGDSAAHRASASASRARRSKKSSAGGADGSHPLSPLSGRRAQTNLRARRLPHAVSTRRADETAPARPRRPRRRSSPARFAPPAEATVIRPAAAAPASARSARPRASPSRRIR